MRKRRCLPKSPICTGVDPYDVIHAVRTQDPVAVPRRLDERQTVVRAVIMLSARGKTEAEAYAQLRQMAMAWRISFEDAAGRIVGGLGKDGGDDGKYSRG